MRILFVIFLLGVDLCFSKIFLGWAGGWPRGLPPVSYADILGIGGNTVAHTNWVALAFARDVPSFTNQNQDGNFKFNWPAVERKDGTIVLRNPLSTFTMDYPVSGCPTSGNIRCGISLGGGNTYILRNPTAVSVTVYQQNAINSIKSLATTYNAAFVELNFEDFTLSPAAFSNLWCPILTSLKSSTSLKIVTSPYSAFRDHYTTLYSSCPQSIDYTAYQCYAENTDQAGCMNLVAPSFGGAAKMLIGLCATPVPADGDPAYRGTQSISNAVSNIVPRFPNAAGVAMWTWEDSKSTTPSFDMVKQVAAAMKFCARPPGWCVHDGSTYTLKDCDGDAIPDPVCSDTSGSFGVLQSANGCKDSWPSGAGATCRCARPSGWCVHDGSTYTLKDCDGDAIPDPVCSDTSGSFGVLQSANGCKDSWPSGAGATCRSGQNSSPTSAPSSQCVDGDMLMNTLHHGSVAVKDITTGMSVQGMRNGEQVWCVVTSNSPKGRGSLIGDFTSNHLVLQDGVLQENGNMGVRRVGDLYNLASDCEFTTNSKGISFTPFASDSSYWHRRLSLSQYYEFFQALIAINSHLPIDIFDLSQFTGNYKAKGDRLCNALVDCLFENRNCAELNDYFDDFVDNNMKTAAKNAVKKVFKNGAAMAHTAKTKRLN